MRFQQTALQPHWGRVGRPNRCGDQGTYHYLRVSTQRQQRSGLGIEAQRAAIARFAEAEGLAIIAEYVEAESGKGADALDLRPRLAAALAAARKVQRPGRQTRPTVTRRGVCFRANGPARTFHRRGIGS